MTYAEKLQDPRWQCKRAAVLNRDDWKCRQCGTRKKTLEVHHVAYHGEPWDTPTDLLLTLCDDCHDDRCWVEVAAREPFNLILASLDADDVLRLAKHLASIAAPLVLRARNR